MNSRNLNCLSHFSFFITFVLFYHYTYSQTYETKHFGINEVTQEMVKAKLIEDDALSDVKFNEIRKEGLRGGVEFLSFNQNAYGIPILGAKLNLHLKNGYVTQASGSWLRSISGLSSKAKIDETNAIEIAMKENPKVKYLWQNKEKQSIMCKHLHKQDDHFKPKAVLVYYTNEYQLNKFPTKLAYQIDLHSDGEYPSTRYFIDAMNGAVLAKETLNIDCNIQAEAITGYSGGPRPIMTSLIIDDVQPIPNSYYILDGCYSTAQIHTLNMNDAPFGSWSTANEFTQAVTFWDDFPNPSDRFGTDVHWGMDRSSNYWDGMGQNPFAGGTILSYVNYSTTFVGLNFISGLNAQWNAADFFSFGNGGGVAGSVTSLDIVGHEYTHAVTGSSAGLVYQGESGAINESISDIFGTLIQAANQSFNWTIGEDIGFVFRDMANPNAFLNPDTYQGVYWASGAADNGGVHTNSGVGNFWFFLLSQGGVGVNDIGNSYDVVNIGISDAESIVIRTLTTYLGPGSNYLDYRQMSIQSAIDLFGYCSQQHISTMNAWHAVGIGPRFNDVLSPNDLWEDPIGPCNAVIHWNDTGSPEYYVRWGEEGEGMPNFEGPILDNFFELNGLTQMTNYEWEVFAVCGDIAFPPIAQSNFTTLKDCFDITDLSISDINSCGGLLSWTHIGGSNYIIRIRNINTGTVVFQNASSSPHQISGISANADYEITVTPICGNCTGNESNMVTLHLPGIPLPNVTIHANSCDLFVYWNPVSGYTYDIWIRSDSTHPFLNPQTFIPGWHSYTFSVIPSHTYFIRIRVYYNDGNCSGFQDIDLEATTPPAPTSCEPPAIQFHVYSYGVTVTCDGGDAATRWIIRYRTSQTGNFTELNINSPVWGFGPTSYLEFCARSICNCSGIVDTSDWACDTFVIQECIAPDLYFSSVRCAETVDLICQYINGASAYEFEFWPEGGQATTIQPINWQWTKTLNNLTPGTTYYWRVRTHCAGLNSISDWGPIQTFTTSPSCDPVMETEEITTGNNIFISWANLPHHSNYFFRYRLLPNGNWIEVPLVVSQITIENLADGTYEYQIRTTCGDCGESDWSILDTFIIGSDNCIPGVGINAEIDGGCDPCVNECYVCVFDGAGTPLMENGSWYEIEWMVPQDYPLTTSELENRQCIPMGPQQIGQTFIANITEYISVEGVKTVKCSTSVSYIHNCGQLMIINLQCEQIFKEEAQVQRLSWKGNPNFLEYELDIIEDLSNCEDPSERELLQIRTYKTRNAFFDISKKSFGIYRVRSKYQDKEYSSKWTCFGGDHCSGLQQRIQGSTTFSVDVFPNPAISSIFIRPNMGGNILFEVSDVLGQVIHTSILKNQTSSTIDVSNWKSGMYILNFTTEFPNERLIKSLIIQR